MKKAIVFKKVSNLKDLSLLSTNDEFLDFSYFVFDGQGNLNDEDRKRVFNESISKVTRAVTAFRWSGAKLPASTVNELLIPTVGIGSNRLQNVTYLDISFVPLTTKAIEAICSIVHPTNGTCKVKVLTLTRCSLGESGTSKLFESLRGNNTIEEITVAGNGAGDGTVPYICSYLLEYKNIVRKLGLGGNNITQTGALLTIENK